MIAPGADLPPETLASAHADIVARACECGCGLALAGRQKRFASRLCNSRWYDQQHPRVNPPRLPREGRLVDVVLGFLEERRGEWVTAHEIAEAARAFPHSVSARLAELRKRGHRIESDARVGNNRRPHRFRLACADEEGSR
ncbi:MAG TPA: hypothetical protein VFO85_09835 [Vicinamibacteria bacterium]|nr:hypothetical protein [Vicinamibacteria bacterium]